jgi:hypothetical protein
MAITNPVLAGPGSFPVNVTGPLSFNNDEDDANGAAVELVGTPGVGKALYLTHITISGRTADIAITLRDAIAGTVLFGPIQMQADGSGLFTKDWEHPLKLTDNKALFVYASAASAFTIYGEYFIGQVPI